ncbi:cell wall-associated hydrolase, invasion-associated protein [Saccharomonospora marina XMU15]|uniref:Cell wall-associated hydrolase, invasion-associated protein n=1 Tax=Saccharomonospora marina XMU15 TaxID=882083 RepID=H5XB89_9PSEU|nr:C40 family peptidase [Saccharomonospora marina]EHR49324.1 cell wall-associated hydrolase, invasion-associated protein [Saccharomonospora marina XMU15]
MRGGLLVGFVAAAATIVLLAAGSVVIMDSQRRQAQGVTPLSCDAAIGPTQPGERSRGSADAANLSDEQRGIVSLIVSIGKRRDLSPRAWQVAIQAGMTESGLRNLDYGDRDSLGIFQMRPSMGWGTPAQVTDPPYQVNKFFDVLESIPGWQSMRPGDAAQAVERSAFPDRYHRWEPMAVHLVENVGEVADATGCGEGMGELLPPNDAAQAAIRFALGERGKPYVWGATGPNSYDCSGLMLRAYEAAGITLPRVSRDQYKAGAMLPLEQAQPGDLLFWAYDPSNPSTIHHVAMYLGEGKIVEAQQSGVPVHTRDVAWDEAELVPQAIRPGV